MPSLCCFFFRKEEKKKEIKILATLHYTWKISKFIYPMSKLSLSMIFNSPCLLNNFSNICDQIYLKKYF